MLRVLFRWFRKGTEQGFGPGRQVTPQPKRDDTAGSRPTQLIESLSEPDTSRRPRHRVPQSRAAPARSPSQRNSSSATATAPKPKTCNKLPRDQWFGSLQVSRPIADALKEMGYTEPTPIQEQAIPPFMDGHDVVGQAMTGTGKTASFGIPLAELINIEDLTVQAIVLTPTRELATQVSAELSRIGSRRGLRVLPVYGGQPLHPQVKALQAGVHLVVGTPGRVMDLMSRGVLRLNHVRFAILDEADEMLDIGFADDMDRILRQTPTQRQTALFSATFPGFIQRLIHRHLNDPVRVRVGGEIETVTEVDQIYYEVSERDIQAGLREILSQQLNGGQALIFCRTQVNVDRLVRYLAGHSFPVYGLHGGKPQHERTSVMQSFRHGDLKILVSTNLASRGIDVPAITHIINYDMPDNVEEYVHRIGRAGRMGRAGTAITLVKEWDFETLDSIIQHVGDKLQHGKLSVSPGAD